ncbi:MAG TPA: hypothetical protein DCZ94_13295 [Lentisphaeria bacterium]|nr:MAG: hypothetical protein A2X48_24430 [Lentisphaerae bacterium GWF2_49_21]HBC87923.1 hypothetical protein [Lentisphaeria bacterium]
MAKRSLFKFLAVFTAFLFSIALFADPVDGTKAESAAKGWLKHVKGAALSATLSSDIASIDTYKDEDGDIIYYVVNLDPEGYIVVSADDDIEPIICLSEEGRYDPNPDNPLFSLLSKDMKGRNDLVRKEIQPAGKRAQMLAMAQKPPKLAEAEKAKGRWDAFTAKAVLKVVGAEDISGAAPVSTINDVRVDKIVQSKWNQSNDSQGNLCYNYYTPSNYLCGCVATSLAQVLRFHQYPTSAIGIRTYTCKIDGIDTDLDTRGSDGLGGAYDWTKMPLVPGSSNTEEERQMIGSLCSDAGVSVRMQYSANFSGAYQAYAADALLNVFGYSNAVMGSDGGGLTAATGLYHMTNTNLDAGLPLIYAIQKQGANSGHSIVCDGYGYNTGTPYHHLNMGWGGSSDMWYNLPNIGTSYGYDSVVEIVYNVYKTGSGEIVSGRVTAGGTPVSGATVQAGAVTSTTNAKGIYALKNLQPGTYDITVTMAGYSPAIQRKTVNVSINDKPTGNIWGVDFALVTGASAPLVVSEGMGSVTSSSVAFNGEVVTENGATVTERGVCYGTAQNPTISGSKVTCGSGAGDFNCTITGLTAETRYYVRAYAKNSVGTSYGENYSFIAHDEIFPVNLSMPAGWYETEASDSPWNVNMTQGYEGNYCISSSAALEHMSESELAYTGHFEAGTVSFYYKVSSEKDFDYFRFYIDGTEMLKLSGEVAWTQASYPVTAGKHTLTWSFSKDQAVIGGTDNVCIDTISLPSLQNGIFVTNPNGAEVWLQNKSRQITWCGGGVSGNVKIELMKNGVLNTVVAASTENDGGFDWTVPAGQTPGTDYTIKVSSVNTPSTNDQSDANFTISAPSITVSSPNGGESLSQDSINDIAWTSYGIEGKVQIELMKGGVSNLMIAESTDNDGAFSWKVPLAQTVASDYKVKISSIDMPAFSDQSNANFSVSEGIPQITITAPNGGESIYRSEKITVKWTSTCITGNIKVELLKGGAAFAVLAESIPNTYKYDWIINTSQNGHDFMIKVSSVSQPAISDQSDAVFSILNPTLDPVDIYGNFTAGEGDWLMGGCNNLSGNVRVDLYKGGVFDRALFTDTPFEGMYGKYWDVPINQPAGTDYFIRTTSVNAPLIYADSVVFAINAAPTLNIVTDVPSLSVPEGSTASFQVKLTEAPPANLTVTVARTGDANITVSSGSSLSFTTSNWNTYQTVTIAATEDADKSNGSATIRCSSPDIVNYLNVTATEADDDCTITVANDGNGTTSPSGAIITEKSTPFSISATPSAGYNFLNWSVTTGSATFANASSASTTVTASADCTVRANFVTSSANPGIIILSSSAYTVAENGGTVTITVKRAGGSSGAASVQYATSNGTAKAADYTTKTGTFNWTDGETADKTFTVAITGDSLDEANETVNITLSSVTGATLGTPSTAVLTITDDDPTPTVAFTVASQSKAENGGTATITAQLSAASGQAVTVPFTVTGTATDPDDYTNTASPISISAGTTTKTITITIADDATVESSETVIVTMGTPTNATKGAITDHTLTITDNDSTASGIIALSSATYSVAENGGTATITVSRTGGGTGAASVQYATSNGTATAGSDYTTKTGTLNWADGDSASKTFAVSITNDSLDEADETVSITLSNISGASLGTPNTASLTITDDDAAPTVNFTAASQSKAENGGTATITAQLSAASGQAVTVPFTVSGTAANPGDYTITTSPITIAAGSTTGTATITIVDDTAYENPDETVIVTMGSPTNATKGTTTVHTLTITDNDSAPAAGTIAFSSATYTVAENVTTATITVKRTGGSSGAASVQYATSNGTATSGSDYTAASGTFSWADGNAADKTFTVAITNDSIDEADETINIALSNATGATLGTPNTSVLTITDDDAAPTLSINDVTITEGNTGTVNATFTVTQSAASGKTVTVSYATADVTAVQPADYTQVTATTLTFNPGDTSKSITVAVKGDALDEVNETFNVNLSSAGNATIADAAGVCTITDDDAAPTVNFTAASQSKAENGGTATITAQLTAASGQAVTVPFTLTGTATVTSDYTITASPITIAAGSTTGTATITIIDDTTYESPDETVIVTMGTPTNATKGTTAVHTLTITENDPPPPTGTIVFSSATYTVAENGTTATITVKRTGGTFGAASVQYATSNGTATSGSDYTAASGTFSWADGNAADKTFTVAITNDTLDEADETVNIALSNVTGATLGTPNTSVLTITDDDAAPTVQFTSASQSKAESAGTATVTAQLSVVSGQVVTVPFTMTGTATGAGTDYSITASPITIPAGSTTADITITIANDSIDELDETMIVTIGTPTNATKGSTGVHTLTITDDDVVEIATSVSSVSVPEGSNATFQVKLSAQPAANVIVSVARSAGDADISVTGGTSLTFTTANWNTYQTVTLAAAEDNADVASGSATVSCTSATANSKNVTANETDDDITLTVNNDGNGSTNISGSQIVDKNNSPYSIIAVPNANYHFVNWTLVSGSATFANANSVSTTVAASADATVRANFAHDTATLTMAVSGSGTTNPAGGSNTVINTATPTAISASAATDWNFAGWTISGNGVIADPSSASTTATLSGNSTATAKFITGAVEPGVPVPAIAAVEGSMKFFKVTVPDGTSLLDITTSGGGGDCDLYVKFGANPGIEDYLERSVNDGNDEEIKVENPLAGTWNIMLYGYGDFSAVQLLVTLQAGGLEQVAGLSLNGIFTDRISLKWKAVAGATGYEIYRATAENLELASIIGTSSSTLFEDKFSAAGTYRYYYWVRATGDTGNGPYSESVYGTNIDGAVVTLANGASVANISGAAGAVKVYKIAVPAGQTLLEIKVSGGTGDCDLDVVREGDNFKRYSVRGSSTETVIIDPVTAGNWLIELTGKTAYSGAALSVKYYKGIAPVPAGLAASDGTFADRIVLNWTASAGASSYEIWRGLKASATDVTGPAAKIAEVSDNTFEDNTGLQVGKTYYYFLKSKNSAGTSALSAGNSGYLLNAPAVPVSVAATDGTYFDRIRISWNKLAGATSYLIFRTEANIAPNPGTDTPFAEISSLNNQAATAFTLDDFGDDIVPLNGTAPKLYYYWMAGRNDNGTTPISKGDSGYLSSKGPVTVTATAGTLFGKIRVTWTSVAGATGYSVHRYADKGCTLGETIFDAGANLVYDDVSAVLGATYYYKVKARYNASYASGFNATAAAGYHKTMTGPASITASAGTYFGKVHVAWAAVIGATGYDLYRYTDNTCTQNQTVFNAGANLMYDDVTAAANTTYYYRVKAKYLACTTNFSPAASGYHKSIAGPATITATAGTLFGKVRVAWGAVAGAANYELFRDGVSVVVVASTRYDDVTGDTLKHVYTVKAKFGTYTSNPSIGATGYAYAGTTTTLTAPTLAASKDLYTNVKLSWTEIPLAENYIIYRSTANVFANAGQLAKVSALVYNDDTAVRGTLYYYWIKSNNDTMVKTSPAGTAVQGRALGTTTTTTNGEVKIVSSGKDGCVYYSIDVPAGTTRLVATLGNTSTAVANDCDLYAKFSSCPTTVSYNAKGVENTASETLTISNPSPGTWYFMLYGYSLYTDVTLTVKYYSVTDIVLTQVPLNDQAVPFTANFKGRVLDETGVTGIAGLSIQVRNPITGMTSWLPAKTDAGGYFTYSTAIGNEGEHTFDFFFNTIPDPAKGTASHTVATRKGCLETNGFFDFSAYLAADPVALSQDDVVGMQTFLDVRNGWTEGSIETAYEEMWIGKTVAASQEDDALSKKLDEGLYMFFYGVEGAGVGNDMKADSALRAVPFAVHVESSKKNAVVANLNVLGIIDDSQMAAILAGKVGVVAVAVLSSATEGADGDMNISMLGREQLEILADIAGNSADISSVEDRKYGDALSKKMTISIDGGSRQINVIVSSFVK